MPASQRHDAPRAGTRVERRKARTRAGLLAAARQLFAAHGLEHTTIAQIAEHADIAIGSFYNYFRTKEELLDALLEEELSQQLALLELRQAHVEDPAEKISIAHRHLVRAAQSDSDWAWLLVRLEVPFRAAWSVLGHSARSDLRLRDRRRPFPRRRPRSGSERQRRRAVRGHPRPASGRTQRAGGRAARRGRSAQLRPRPQRGRRDRTPIAPRAHSPRRGAAARVTTDGYATLGVVRALGVPRSAEGFAVFETEVPSEVPLHPSPEGADTLREMPRYSQRIARGVSRMRITRAGTPATTAFAGTSLVTTELVPMTLLSPTLTPRRMHAP